MKLLLLLCLFCAYRRAWSYQAEPTSESITAAGGKIEELVTAEPLNVEQILNGVVEVDAKPKTKETISKKGPALFKELADAKILPIAVGEPNGQAGESVTASGTIEELVTSKPLNLEQIIKGIFEVDAKPKTKESEAKKRPNLFKELAEKYARYFTKDKKKPDVQILPMPIAVGEPNGQKSIDFSLDGYFYQGDKKIANYRIDFHGVHFKQALRGQRPSELVDPRPSKGGDKDDGGEIEIDELVDPLPPKGDKDGEIEIDELIDPRPEKPRQIDDDVSEVLVDPRPAKPVESKDNDKELVDPRPDKPSKDGEKPTDELVDPKPVEPIEDKENTPIICFEDGMITNSAETTTTAETLITAADPAGTTEARKQTEHVEPATIEQAGTTTEAEKLITPEVHAPVTAALPGHVTDKEEAVDETTTGAGPIAAEPAATTGAGPVAPVENEGDPTPTIGDSTPEVDPVPTKEAADSTTGVAVESEKPTAPVDAKPTPVEEVVISTTGAATPNVDEDEHKTATGAATIDDGNHKSTEAAKEEVVVSTTGPGPIDAGHHETEAAKEEVPAATTGAGPIDAGHHEATEAAAAVTAQGNEDGPVPTDDRPVYTGVPPKYDFGNKTCTTMYEFYFDEQALRCLGKRFYVCNEEEWKKVSQEKTYGACMKTAPRVMPADNNVKTKCDFGKVWAKVPGEPSADLYLRRCDDHACPTQATCVLDTKYTAHCCILARWALEG